MPTPYRFFRVEVSSAAPAPPPVITPLANGVPYTNTIASSATALDYFRFTVSTNAVSVAFELTPRNGDLGLVAKKGQPLPDRVSYAYLADKPGLTNEIIQIATNSLPVPLTAGDWYLGVFNKSTNAVAYTIRAVETAAAPPTTNLTLTLNAPLLVGSNNLCVAWKSGNGVAYRVQGREEVAAGGWTNLSGAITATNATTTYCITLPSRYRFFRIIEDSVTPPAPSGVRLSTPAVLSSGRVDLTWEATIGQRYEVQISTNLISTNWVTFTNLTATAKTATVRDSGAGTNSAVRFYRVRLTP